MRLAEVGWLWSVSGASGRTVARTTGMRLRRLRDRGGTEMQHRSLTWVALRSRRLALALVPTIAIAAVAGLAGTSLAAPAGEASPRLRPARHRSTVRKPHEPGAPEHDDRRRRRDLSRNRAWTVSRRASDGGARNMPRARDGDEAGTERSDRRRCLDAVEWLERPLPGRRRLRLHDGANSLAGPVAAGYSAAVTDGGHGGCRTRRGSFARLERPLRLGVDPGLLLSRSARPRGGGERS